MRIDLEQFRRRALALALLVLALAIGIEAVVVPVVSWYRDVRDDRDQSLRELAKMQALVDAAPAMQDALAKIDQHPLWQHVYTADGGTQLQQDFRGLVEAQGITLDSVQPLDPATLGDFHRFALRVAFNTSIDHLSHLLLAMQAAPRTLRFENLYITAPMSLPPGQNATLVVRGDVVGLGRPESP